MFILKEEYITLHFVKNQQSISNTMTTELFPFWVQPSFVGIATCLFFHTPPFPPCLECQKCSSVVTSED